MTITADPLAARVRAAAFRRLLRIGTPATAAQLAAGLEYGEPAVHTAINGLARRGSLRLDDQGRVIGSAGLSIHPDRHEIDLDGRRFWTWCAYDIFGIFAALGASGHARSAIPDSAEPLQLRFHDGEPDPAPLVLFRPDEDYAACCTNTYEQWCPHSNLFRTAGDATAWADKHGVTGTVLTLSEAAQRGGQAWRALAQDQ